MVSKMLVIKKISKEDPSTAFSAGFATASALPTNGSKAPIAGSSVYKNLVPKPAVAPTKVRLAVMCHIQSIRTNEAHLYAIDNELCISYVNAVMEAVSACDRGSLYVLPSRAPSGNPVVERSLSLAFTCQAEIQSSPAPSLQPNPAPQSVHHSTTPQKR